MIMSFICGAFKLIDAQHKYQHQIKFIFIDRTNKGGYGGIDKIFLF